MADKQKIIIYGAGQMARIAILSLKELLEDFENQVIGCVVTSVENNPRVIENLNVHDLDYYKNYGNNFLYLIAVRERFRTQIIEELKNRGINNLEIFEYQKYKELLEKLLISQNKDRYKEFVDNFDDSILSDEDYILFLSRQLKVGTLNFEVNLAEHCNLNCQCCNHFSPLAEKKFLDCTVLENDLKQLNKVLDIDNAIGKVMLLGGEPLLHPYIERILKISGKYLSTAKLEVVTNGILIPKMSLEFWELLRKYNIGLIVTKYPIKYDYTLAEKVAEENGIIISYGDSYEPIKTTYHLPIKDEPEFNPYSMYAKCKHANQCVVLKKGHLYTCPLAANIEHYNKYFEKHIPEGEEVSIDIYKINTWKEAEEFLKRPNKMCCHCDICHYTYDIPWAISKREMLEWS